MDEQSGTVSWEREHAHMEYTQSSTAWSRSIWDQGEKHCVDEVLLTIVLKDGTIADFGIRWYQQANGFGTVIDVLPRLHAFSESWEAMARIGFLDALNEYPYLTRSPRGVLGSLRKIGFVPSEFHDEIKKEEEAMRG